MREVQTAVTFARIVRLIAECSSQEEDFMKKIAVVTAVLFLAAVVVSAQMNMGGEKKASPAEGAACKFSDGKTLKVDYSSPRGKGRKIYGGLVPYGQVWRTGADEATKFVSDTSLTVGGKDAGRELHDFHGPETGQVDTDH